MKHNGMRIELKYRSFPQKKGTARRYMAGGVVIFEFHSKKLPEQ
jgi:hypothetical protein